MKKFTIILLTFVALALSSAAKDAAYRIISQCDTTIKAKLEGISLGSREVRHFVYEYPSTDADGQEVTISGIIMAPLDIVDGSVPCDGIIMYNHFTIGSPDDAPSKGGKGIEAISAILSSPLKPNYIIVASDYIGYGSSIDHNVSYICGDTNGRNSLDGLLAARQLLADQQIPQGRYLFNLGYSQGGTESMYAARLTDTDEKYRDIRFDKTFSGGGPLDIVNLYTTYAASERCEDVADVVLMLISVNENYHLGIDYSDMFQEPMASRALDYFHSKDKSVVAEIGVTSMKSIGEVLAPTILDMDSEPARKLVDKLKEISITEGWEPDITKNYYLEHSRHDNYVPIQSGRGMITWMKEKGFRPSIVPGKTSLQTNTVVFRLTHQQAAIVWAIQTLAAIQFWPVLYYEGEQNRYFHDVVFDLNLMKVIKMLESIGIDLRKVVNEGGLNFSRSAGGPAKLPNNYTLFDLVPGLDEKLAKVGLTTDDLEEMCEDSGITTLDLLNVVAYIKGIETTPATEPTLEERIEAPLYLLRSYEQQLAAWFLLGGFDVNYSHWGN